MRIKHRLFLFTLVLLSALSSCVEDVDFTQFEGFETTPMYETSILYLEAPEDIINLAVGTNVFSQNFSFEAFSSDLFESRVIDGVVTFVVENTTSKRLEITIDFLDNNEIVLDTETFNINPEPTAVIKREIAYGDSGRSIEIIKSLSNIRVLARNLGDNSSISSLENPIIKLGSSGKFRLRLIK